MKLSNCPSFCFAVLAAGVLLCATQLPAQSKPQTVEEIVARVNNQIITLTDYQKAEAGLREEVAHDCQGCTPDKIQAEVKDQEKDLLRGLIDNLLLVERAKDMNISVDTDVVKQLDDVRQQNKLDSMEALQKAVESSGMSWEDYKTQMKNQLLRQKVIQQEVSGRMDISPDVVQQYYNAHKTEFVMPEQVVLSEIFLSTEGRTPEEIESIRKKAEDLHGRLVRGEDFAQIAQRYSEGQTARDSGGELGSFKRGVLDPALDDAVFRLNKGQFTDVIQTKTGFEILKVDQHYQAGQQPLSTVENQIENKLYMQQMEPALRKYLAQLREESYITIKPGYKDTAAVAGQTAIEEVPATPDEGGKKKKKKLKIPKITGS